MLFFQLYFYQYEPILSIQNPPSRIYDYKIAIVMKKTFKKVKQLVIKCDLFANSKLMRFSQEPEYKSANGGIISVAIIIAFIVIFINTVVSTLDMTTINSTSTHYQESDPTDFTTTTSGFMFAIGVTNFNLTDPTTKYFNIEFSQKISNPKKTIFYTLVPCSRSTWTSAYPGIGDTFDRRKLQYWLCLPPNISLTFQGKFTSDVFQYVKIALKACSPTVGDNRTCVNQTVIDNMIAKSGPLSFNYYFMNTIINPNDPDYLKSYLQDRNYFTFTMQAGMSSNMFISLYDIQTDVSLLPLTNIVQDTGGMVYEPTQNFIVPINSGNTDYVQLFIRKSSLSLSVTRSFYKYFDCLSYIGGLFSSIMIALFFMQFYNEFSYEIDVSSEVYKYTDNKKIKSEHFNILTFLAYVFYNLVGLFGVKPEWKLLKQFDHSREQIKKQLNIKLILQKIEFLQDCMEYIFQDFQLKCLHLKGKLSLNQAKKIRKRFSSRTRILKLKNKKKDQKEQTCKKDQISKGNSMNPLHIQNQEIIAQVHNSLQEIQSDGGVKRINKVANASSSRITYPKEDNSKVQISISENQEESSLESISSQSQNQQETFCRDILSSLKKLESEATHGKERCLKIYKSLDNAIKKVPNHFIQQTIKLERKKSKEASPKYIHQNESVEIFEFDLDQDRS